MDLTHERRSHRGIVDPQGSVRDGDGGGAIRAGSAQGQRAAIDVGVGRPVAVGVVAGQHQCAWAVLVKAEAVSADYAGDGVHTCTRVGVDEELIASTRGQVPTGDGHRVGA